jgi:hypothetical protein
MALITNLFATGLLAWFGLLALLLAIRILRGDIPGTGLLLHHRDDENVAPERVLAMAVFPFVMISYIYSALQVNLAAPGMLQLPELPASLLNLVIGSNGLYLAGKIARG